MIVSRYLTDIASANTASNIELGSCVTEIGKGAFSGYTNITEVEFPDSLTTIGAGAFSGSSITSVDFPDSLAVIGDSAFTSCNLSEITIPSGVTRIGEDAFAKISNLREIKIPDSVTSLGESVFDRCTNLTECTIGSGVTSIGNTLFRYCGKIKKVRITAPTPPVIHLDTFDETTSTYSNYPIYVPCESYNDYIAAQYWSSYKSRIVCDDLPYKVKYYYSDGSYAGLIPCDSDSSLTSTAVNNTYQNEYTKIELGNCINNVVDAFSNISTITDVMWDTSSANTITGFSGAFNNCTNASFPDLPPNVTMLRTSFNGCKFANLTINSGVTLSGSTTTEYAPFRFTNIRNLYYDCVNGTLEPFGFSYIGSLTFGNNVSVLGNYSFIDCSGFTDVVLPNSVTSIGSYTFRRCSDVTAATIPSGSIGGNVFEACPKLKQLTIGSAVTLTKDSWYSFSECTSLSKINSNTEGVGYINVNVIPRYFLNKCAVQNLTLGENVSQITQSSLEEMPNLSKVHIIGNSGTTIMTTILNGCSNLQEVEIDNCASVSYAGGPVFGSSPKKVTVGGGAVNGIKLSGMTTITDVVFKDGATTISDGFFSGCTSLKNIDIPSGVTSIGASAFTNCKSMTTLIIPNNVISIGNSAFSGCSGLNSILIGKSTPPAIGTNVFAGSNCLIYVPQASYDLYINAENWSTYKSRIYPIGVSYKAALFGGTEKIISCNDNTTLSLSEVGSNKANIINIGDCVTTIGESAFTSSNSIQTVSIPRGVTSINERAFYNRTTLTTVSGMQGIINLGESCFHNCSGLTNITLSNTTTSIGANCFIYCRRLKDITIPDSVTSIGEYAFSNCSNLTSATIGNSVTSISNWAFNACTSLSSVTIGNSVTSIGSSAFQSCGGLASITIPNSVTTIGSSAFALCDSLSSVTIGNSVTNIGSYAFQSCGFTSITIPNSVTTIGSGAFKDCSSLTSVTIPDSVAMISDYVFASCSSLTSVTIPDNITTIGGGAFQGCRGLTSIVIPSSVTSIGGYAFSTCTSLASITIPDGVTMIDMNTFYNCSSLTSVTIPDSVTSIRGRAFESCSSLTSVTIGNSVTRINSYAFQHCSSLASVTIHRETPPGLDYFVFEDTNNCIFYVPAASVDAYKTANRWSEYASRIQAIPNS